MTVPGKGGRPRKWASDRDRQRAWRARQQGQPEPTQYREALDDGDLLAAALAERRRAERDARRRRHEAARVVTPRHPDPPGDRSGGESGDPGVRRATAS